MFHLKFSFDHWYKEIWLEFSLRSRFFASPKSLLADEAPTRFSLVALWQFCWRSSFHAQVQIWNGTRHFWVALYWHIWAKECLNGSKIENLPAKIVFRHILQFERINWLKPNFMEGIRKWWNQCSLIDFGFLFPESFVFLCSFPLWVVTILFGWRLLFRWCTSLVVDWSTNKEKFYPQRLVALGSKPIHLFAVVVSLSKLSL